MAKIPQLLLAAGASRRMGQPKQLLPWGSQLLIEHQVRTLMQTEEPVIVVLGAHKELVEPVLARFPVEVLINQQWKNGMGSSIAFGVSHLEETHPVAGGVLITLLDQPLVTAGHYNSLLNAFRAGTEQIIVSRSGSGWEGVPALFDRAYFEALRTLNGEEGARKIVHHFPHAVTAVECNDILEDMDTPEAYRHLLDKFNQ